MCHSSHLQVYLGLLFMGMLIEGSPTITSEVSGLAKEKVVLPCRLSTETCGPIHSIKWHRGFRRVYIFSEIGSTSKAEDDLIGRAELRLDTNNSLALLEINPLMTADEDLYKCEVTYLEAKEHCALLQYIRLNTFAKPEYVRIENMSGTETTNASLIGPYNEGTVITLVCNSKGGKPVAKLDWFNNSVPLEGQYSNVTEHDGTGIGTSQIQIELGRGDLGTKLECRGSTPTLKIPMIAWVEVDVYVRPASWEVTGYESPVLEGTIVTLLCRVKGARPSANITWYNGTKPLSHQPHSNLAVQSTEGELNIEGEIIEADGTYETQSRLSFTATRHDNGIILDCQTSNLVLESMGELPYRSLTKIQVNYKPVVTVSPSNLTVNETTDIYLACDVDANPPELISVRWYQNGQLLELSDISHYEGGTSLDPTLLIKNSTREDLGNYTCVVQNIIGEMPSEGRANVNIFYKATVSLSMDPPIPVREQDERDVTLSCDIESANPETVDTVRWYLDGEFLKQLPECNVTVIDNIKVLNELCDLDPTKLMLLKVEKKFQGSYQCKARNAAGWGELSLGTMLYVNYPPGNTSIKFDPLIAVKGQILNLQCELGDPGRPPTKEFRWWRGSHVQIDQSTSNWTIFPVSLESRANFSCEGINEAGHGPSASVPIDVFVPPTFITPLMPYHGVPWNATEVKITCQVECSPLCQIYWLKNGVPINFQSHVFTIKNTQLPPDPAKNDFESIISTLAWNMTAWPNGKLNRAVDNDNYTCQSSENEHGLGVHSTTHFRVEYPPEKINVSARFINVKEDEYPDVVTCSANALPEAAYTWKYGNEIVSEKNVLFLNYTLKRDRGGDYECIAQNLHGQISTRTTINVQYVPECKITFEDLDEMKILVCTANANPGLVDFHWWLGNATIPFPENVEKKGLKSELKLSPLPQYFGTYRCFANNSVGISNSCEYFVSGSWIRKISDNTLLIFGGVAVAVIILFIIVCIIIILVCRRRRMNEKHHNTRPEERQNYNIDYEQFIINLYGPGVIPEGKDLNGSMIDGSLGSGTSSRNQSPGPSDNNNTSESNKWPIKPGVHLHVNGLQSLGKSVNRPINGFSYGTKNSVSTLPLNSTSHSLSADIPAITNRKRKKPKRDPSPAHRKGDLSDDGKAFYENLPFHGLQSPQSKPIEPPSPPPPPPVSIPTTNDTEVRPPSELSQTGSSGYGSTRSQNQKDPGTFTTDPTTGTTSTALPHVNLQSRNDSSPSTLRVHIDPKSPPICGEGSSSVQGPKTSTPIQSLSINKIPLPISNSKQTNLATIKPQRISSISYQNNSFGSLRPFRRSSPEAPKIFFSSVRGKNPNPPPSLSHFLTQNSIRLRRDTTSPTSNIANTLQQLVTIANSTQSQELKPKPKPMSELMTSPGVGPVSKETKLHPSKLSSKIPAQIKPSSKIVVKKNVGSTLKKDQSEKSTVLPHNTCSSVCPDETWKPVPHAAPRIQTLKHARRHTYQNIPFTRKTPRCETLLTPLSLQYHQSNNQLHHPLSHHHHHQQHTQQGNHYQPATGGIPYATTIHRTFPSTQPSDVIFSSLQRKNGRLSTTTGDGVESHRGRQHNWYSESSQPNGKYQPNGGSGSTKPNGRLNNQNSNGSSSSSTLGHQNNNGQGPGLTRTNNGGLHFPLMRGNEINV